MPRVLYNVELHTTLRGVFLINIILWKNGAVDVLLSKNESYHDGKFVAAGCAKGMTKSLASWRSLIGGYNCLDKTAIGHQHHDQPGPMINHFTYDRIYTVKHAVAWWRHTLPGTLVNCGWGNGLVPTDTKLFLDPHCWFIISKTPLHLNPFWNRHPWL